MERESSLHRVTKGKFLKMYLTHYGYLYRLMTDCLHSHEGEPNRYHLEDNLWTHTMLVFNGLNLFDPSLCYNGINISDVGNKVILTAALVHDYGKISRRQPNRKGDGVAFYGHGQAGTQFAAEVCHKLFGDDPDFGLILHCVTLLTSRHIDAYQLKDKGNIEGFCNNSWFITECFNRLLSADEYGQITDDDNDRMKNPDLRSNQFTIAIQSLRECGVDPILDLNREIYLNKDGSKLKEDDDINGCIFCGAPGVGKDYLALKLGFKIFSFDDIRVAEYIKEHPEAVDSCDPDTLYNEAYRWCNSNKVDLMALLRNAIVEFRAINGTDAKIAICNTSLTVKSRKQLFSLLKKILGKTSKIGCKFIICNTKDYIARDADRKEKTVKEHVINWMIPKMSIPTQREGFHKVEVIWNDTE